MTSHFDHLLSLVESEMAEAADRALAAQSPVLPPSGVEAVAQAQKLFDREIYKLDQKLTECEAAGQDRYVSNLSAQRKQWVACKLALSAGVAGEASPWCFQREIGGDWYIRNGDGSEHRLLDLAPNLEREALKDLAHVRARHRAAPSPALDPGTVEAVCRRYLESALRWHEVFEDGRGGNDLSLHDTLNMMVDRMVRALASPAPGNADHAALQERTSK